VILYKGHYIVYKTGEIGQAVNADKTSMVLFKKKEEFRGFFPSRLSDTDTDTDTEQSG
jgi:hypothetical protein